MGGIVAAHPLRASRTAMPDTAATAPPADERLARVNVLATLVGRPDIGAVFGAIAVFFLFSYTASSVGWLSDLGIWSQWMDQSAQYGIVAVPVALLMIGGEFDLSAGVMVGSSGLLLGLLTTRADWNVWPSIAVVLVFGAAIGFINGYTVVKTKLPSFIVTLGTFFILQGVNAGGTLKITGTVAINGIDSALRLRLRAALLRLDGRGRRTTSRSTSSGGSASRWSGPGCWRARASATGSTRSAAMPWPRATSACPSIAPRSRSS